MQQRSKPLIAKLQRKADGLSKKHKTLVEVNTELVARCAVLEQLIQQRNALVCVLERLTSDAMAAAGEATQQKDAAVEALLPLQPGQHSIAASVINVDQQLFAQVMALTPQSAAAYWVDKVRDVALQMYLHDRDPFGTLPLLTATVTGAIRYCNYIHVFNPAIAYALLDWDMLNGRHQPPPPGHSASIAAAMKFTAEQQLSIQLVLAVVKPRLQQLEAEKQELLEELRQLPDDYSGSSTAAGPATSSDGSSDGSSASGSVTHAHSQVRWAQQRRQDLMHKLERNYAAWRTVAQMRGQWMSSSCSAVQLASGILQSFPYMPFGAPVADSTSSMKPKSEENQTTATGQHTQGAAAAPAAAAAASPAAAAAASPAAAASAAAAAAAAAAQ